MSKRAAVPVLSDTTLLLPRLFELPGSEEDNQPGAVCGLFLRSLRAKIAGSFCLLGQQRHRKDPNVTVPFGSLALRSFKQRWQLVLKCTFCTGSFLLNRLKMSSGGAPITSAVEDGWASPEGCSRIAVGSTLLLPFTERGYSAP